MQCILAVFRNQGVEQVGGVETPRGHVGAIDMVENNGIVLLLEPREAWEEHPGQVAVGQGGRRKDEAREGVTTMITMTTMTTIIVP